MIKSKLFEELGLTLGIAKPESKEDLDGIELFERKVLRKANKLIKTGL